VNGLLGTPAQRAEWYIRAERHDLKNHLVVLIGAAMDRAPDATAKQLVRGYYDSFLDALDGLGKSADLDADMAKIRGIAAQMEAASKIEGKSDVSSRDLEKVILGVNASLDGLGSAIANADYMSKQVLSDIVRKVVVDVYDARSDKLSGTSAIDLKLDRGSGEVRTHKVSPFDMYLLFSNIINNALDATERGAVSVVTNYAPFAGIVCVENPGIMRPEVLEKMMRRKRFTTKPNGHGDGMPIVHDLVNKYGGTLAITPGTILTPTKVEVAIPYNKP
jgi:signal transduction histidine kinase